MYEEVDTEIWEAANITTYMKQFIQLRYVRVNTNQFYKHNTKVCLYNG